MGRAGGGWRGLPLPAAQRQHLCIARGHCWLGQRQHSWRDPCKPYLGGLSASHRRRLACSHQLKPAP